MEQFVGSNYPVFISEHIQESSTETSDYKDGVLHGLMSDFPYGRILLVAETGATAPGELLLRRPTLNYVLFSSVRRIHRCVAFSAVT